MPALEPTIEARYRKGSDLLTQGQIGEACEAFAEALETCPDLLDDIRAALGRTSDRRRAADFFQQRVASTPSAKASDWALAAAFLHDVGRSDESLACAERAVAADPASAAWWFALGDVYLDLAKRAEARGAYQHCLRLQPDSLAAQARLQLCRPPRGSWLARTAARLPLVRRLLRRVIRSGGRLRILERRGDCAAAHQMRWAQGCEQGSALSLFPLPPRAVEPREVCQKAPADLPPAWRWFLQRGIADEIRTVLDMGCGTGFLTENFVRHGFAVSGATSNPHEKRESEAKGIRVIEADFHFLPIPDGTFDFVFSSHSLEHSISPLFALWEWKRVLRPGGYLMIVVPLPVEQDARTSHEHYDPTTDSMQFTRTNEQVPSLADVRTDHSVFGMYGHIYILQPDQLKHAFALTGFEIVAEDAEDPVTCELVGLERALQAQPRGAERPYNGFFLLRKPGA